MYGVHPPILQNLEYLYMQAQGRAEARTKEIQTLQEGLRALSQSILERLALLEREQAADVSLMNQYRIAAQGQVPPTTKHPAQPQHPQQPQQQQQVPQAPQVPLSANTNLSPQDIERLAAGQVGPNGQPRAAKG